MWSEVSEVKGAMRTGEEMKQGLRWSCVSEGLGWVGGGGDDGGNASACSQSSNMTPLASTTRSPERQSPAAAAENASQRNRLVIECTLNPLQHLQICCSQNALVTSDNPRRSCWRRERKCFLL
jgi:hypothetical protein